MEPHNPLGSHPRCTGSTSASPAPAHVSMDIFCCLFVRDKMVMIFAGAQNPVAHPVGGVSEAPETLARHTDWGWSCIRCCRLAANVVCKAPAACSVPVGRCLAGCSLPGDASPAAQPGAPASCRSAAAARLGHPTPVAVGPGGSAQVMRKRCTPLCEPCFDTVVAFCAKPHVCLVASACYRTRFSIEQEAQALITTWTAGYPAPS